MKTKHLYYWKDQDRISIEYERNDSYKNFTINEEQAEKLVKFILQCLNKKTSQKYQYQGFVALNKHVFYLLITIILTLMFTIGCLI